MPDAERLAVAWCLANDPIRAALGGLPNVGTRLPATWTGQYLRCVRIPGLTKDLYVDLDNAMIQFDAYAPRGSSGPDYAAASTLIRTVIDEADKAASLLIAAEGGVIESWQILDGPSRVEEPETGWARYRADLLLVCRPA